MRYNIAISGVGGLGILTLGRIISRGALTMGKNAIMSEIHGLSQRYGNVFVHLRISDGETLAPTIPRGRANLLIALEPIESLRVHDVIGPETTVIMNANVIPPPTTTMGIESYPEFNKIVETLKKITRHVIIYNALPLAEKLGDPRFQNTILLGIATNIDNFPIPTEKIRFAIQQEFKGKEKIAKKNLEAFELGIDIGKNLVKQQS